MTAADVRYERYEVSHCSEREEMPKSGRKRMKQDGLVKSIKGGR